jgi:hypothetical protein
MRSVRRLLKKLLAVPDDFVWTRYNYRFLKDGRLSYLFARKRTKKPRVSKLINVESFQFFNFLRHYGIRVITENEILVIWFFLYIVNNAQNTY